VRLHPALRLGAAAGLELTLVLAAAVDDALLAARRRVGRVPGLVRGLPVQVRIAAGIAARRAAAAGAAAAAAAARTSGRGRRRGRAGAGEGEELVGRAAAAPLLEGGAAE